MYDIRLWPKPLQMPFHIIWVKITCCTTDREFGNHITTPQSTLGVCGAAARAHSTSSDHYIRRINCPCHRKEESCNICDSVDWISLVRWTDYSYQRSHIITMRCGSTMVNAFSYVYWLACKALNTGKQTREKTGSERIENDAYCSAEL